MTASTQGTPIRDATIGDATMEELLAEIARRTVDEVGTRVDEVDTSKIADEVGTSSVAHAEQGKL